MLIGYDGQPDYEGYCVGCCIKEYCSMAEAEEELTTANSKFFSLYGKSVR